MYYLKSPLEKVNSSRICDGTETIANSKADHRAYDKVSDYVILIFSENRE